jgi:hypothetical protein
MYDALTARYTFACPRREHAHVALSSFRLLERLPGATHPAVFEVRFDCTCGEQHPGLVSHEDLDWAPLGGHAGAFVDLMTSRILDSATELRETAAAHLQAGEWPWSFYCYPEERPRPVFPSSFFLLTPGDGSLGLAVHCPVCRRTSVNVVSHEHVDVPFHNDREVGVVEQVFPDDITATVEEFRAELWSASFDARRLTL